MPKNFGKIDPEQTPEEREAQAQEEESLFAPGGKLSDAFKAPPPKVANPPAVELPEQEISETEGAGFSKLYGGSQQPPTAQRAQLAHQLGKTMAPREPDTETPALQKAISPTATPARPPFQLVPSPPSGNPRPVINLPKGTGQIPATATMFLFIALAAVVLFRPVLQPLLSRAGTGNKTPVTLPSSSGISLLLFGVLLVFVSELGPTAAQFTALFMFALWAVFLVMNPTVVTTFAGWVSQSNQAATAQQSQAQ